MKDNIYFRSLRKGGTNGPMSQKFTYFTKSSQVVTCDNKAGATDVDRGIIDMVLSDGRGNDRDCLRKSGPTPKNGTNRIDNS